ncbi:MAG: trypsin-like peptidase domain-containing protein [Planctomycetota bacterium]
MRLEEAAFVNLVALARVDGFLSPSELSMLDRHREALGLSAEFAKETLSHEELKPLPSGKLQGTQGDRLQILKMLIRVAYADRRISKPEMRLLKRVARSFGTGRLALRSLCWEIERELGVRRKLRTSQIAMAITIGVAAVAITLIYLHFNSQAEDQIQETRISFDAMKEKMGLERSQAEEALREIDLSNKALLENETVLTERIQELERRTAAERDTLNTFTSEQQSRQAGMRQEMDRLRSELARIRTSNALFQEIEKEYGHSILLIFTTYELVLDPSRITRGSMGSGFFVSSMGHLVTNKHVAQPWKFNGDDIMLMENGYTLDAASMLIAAWPAGAEVKTATGHLNIADAFSTAAQTLVVESVTPDTFETQRQRLGSGASYQGRFHAGNEADLAVLRAVSPTPFKSIPLIAAAEKLKKLDPVMVLGYPTGLNILESTRAETSPSLGEVRKIERSIMVTAPIFPGNSGGPLVDIQGRVVGVASGIYGEATLGTCIPSRFILPLLPSAAVFLGAIPGYEASHQYRAALDDLRLAEQRCSDDEERKAINALRSRLFSIRDRLLLDARNTEDRTARDKAYRDILDGFGPKWAEEALNGLKSP